MKIHTHISGSPQRIRFYMERKFTSPDTRDCAMEKMGQHPIGPQSIGFLRAYGLTLIYVISFEYFVTSCLYFHGPSEIALGPRDTKFLKG